MTRRSPATSSRSPRSACRPTCATPPPSSIPLLGADAEAVLKALRTNTAYLQSEVARRVNTKYAAKLKFLLDESFDEGSHIDKLLRDAEGGAGSRR